MITEAGFRGWLTHYASNFENKNINFTQLQYSYFSQHIKFNIESWFSQHFYWLKSFWMWTVQYLTKYLKRIQKIYYILRISTQKMFSCGFWSREGEPRWLLLLHALLCRRHLRLVHNQKPASLSNKSWNRGLISEI